MEILSVFLLSKALRLDYLSGPQIWNIEQEKDREKEEVGGRPAKLNEKKGDRDLEREIKKNNKGYIKGGLATAFDLAAFRFSMIAPVKKSVNHSRTVASMRETG